MRTQHTETVISSISFNSGHQTTVNEDQVEQAGQSILSLLDKAAGITEANRQRATDVEQKLTYQLRTASSSMRRSLPPSIVWNALIPCVLRR